MSDRLFDHNAPATVEPASTIRTSLMGHQYRMLQAMEIVERGTIVTLPDLYRVHTSFGIVGDRVGSGKTLTVLTACASLPEPRVAPKFTGSSSDDGLETCPVVLEDYPTQTGSHDVPTNLIVIPYHLEHQWIHELKTRTTLRWTSCTRTMFQRPFDFTTWGEYDVVLCRNTVFTSLYSNLSQQAGFYRFRRVWVDEADTIRILNVPPIWAKFTWAITGTPIALTRTPQRYNKSNMIRSMCMHVRWTSLRSTGAMHAVVLQNDPTYVDECLELPTPVFRYVQTQRPLSVTVLDGILPERSLLCLAADDVEGALSHFDCVPNETNVVGVVTRSLRNRLHYEEGRLRLAQETQMTVGERDSIQRCVDHLRNQLECIRQRIETANECPICFEPLNTDEGTSVVVECCQNKMCVSCLAQIQITSRQTCPFCKSALTKDNVVITHRGTSFRPHERSSLPTKTEAFEILVRELVSDPRKRVLVFSETDGTWTSVRRCLDAANISYQMVKGSCDEIRRVVAKFDTGEARVLLLHSSRTGSGLNLQSTTDVVLYHPPSSSTIEQQIVGRANRSGRKGKLTVHVLTY